MLIEQNKQTYGERKVESLLLKLPKSQAFTEVEPELYDERGRDHKPDFVTILRDYGVVIIEVKDWVKIVSFDNSQNTVTIEKRDGDQVVKQNPFIQCRDHAYTLSSKYQKRKELLRDHFGVKKLKFPWQSMVILPNIENDVIKQLIEGGFLG